MVLSYLIDTECAKKHQNETDILSVQHTVCISQCHSVCVKQIPVSYVCFIHSLRPKTLTKDENHDLADMFISHVREAK